MTSEDVRRLLDECIFDGGHVAKTEATEAKLAVKAALVEAGEVLLRHEKLLARDVVALDRQWSV